MKKFGEKSKKVTLILCVLFGIFGAHKFYVGKFGLGVLYLFTGGLFGIGWIIDIILIITENLKDKYSLDTIQVTDQSNKIQSYNSNFIKYGLDTIQVTEQNNKVQTYNSNFIKYEFNLAGVTFDNNEGKSRQTLLRKLKFQDEPFINKVKFSLEKFKYNDEDAIRVLANGEDIGNVPRNKLSYVLNNYDNIVDVQVLTIGGGVTDDGEKLNYGGKVLLGINLV